MNEVEAVAKQSPDGDARQAHVAEERDGAARAVAQQHEADEEQSGKQRAPEDNGPAVLDRKEPCQRAAEAPDNGRAKHQHCSLHRVL